MITKRTTLGARGSDKLVKYSSVKAEMAMARDDHYNSDLPVFYKNYYELPRHQVRTVFSLCSRCHATLSVVITYV